MPQVNAKQSLYVLALHGAIALAVVIAATVLAFHGALDAEAATAIFGAAIGLAGGSASSLGALAGAVNGKSTITEASLAQRESTLRTALVAAAATPSHEVVAPPPPPAAPGTE